MPLQTEELRQIYNDLTTLAARCEDEILEPLKALIRAAEEVGKAWSGSWIGFHSLIYYAGISPPPPGQHFSSEWGLDRSTGDWREWSPEDIRASVLERAGEINLDRAGAPYRPRRASASQIEGTNWYRFLSLLAVSAIASLIASSRTPKPSSFQPRAATRTALCPTSCSPVTLLRSGKESRPRRTSCSDARPERSSGPSRAVPS